MQKFFVKSTKDPAVQKTQSVGIMSLIYQILSVWLAQLVKTSAASMHVQSCHVCRRSEIEAQN